MKTAFLSLLLALALAGAGCGNDEGQGLCSAFPGDPLCIKTSASGDVCTQAMAIVGAGYDLGCQGFPDCCFCECWQAGGQMPLEIDPCTCQPVQSQACDEEMQGYAQACLDNPAECQQAGVDAIADYCYYYDY